MSDLAIRVENLSKKYHIGRNQERYKTLRDTISATFVAPFRRAGKLLSGQATGAAELDETIWALKDVSFEVKHGEIIGIIGRNGAGKSTLLKILSRITEPTKGCAEMYGRVGSLLEVGTGFHPELTGRENAYLNGAILGMRRAEIDRKFDEIVAFAEVEKFIDTPVKHYSSGMGVRLAFSIAAHLEPEILVIDEVLAVGDVAFQRKCLGKMGEIAGEGRTVLFVSHNMAAIDNLCKRGIVIENGQIAFNGTQSQAITQYLMAMEYSPQSLRVRTDRLGTGDLFITEIEFRDTRGNRLDAVCAGQDVDIFLHYEIPRDILSATDIVASFMVKTQMDIPIFLHHNRLSSDSWQSIPAKGAFVCRIKRLPLAASSYNLTTYISQRKVVLDHVENAAKMMVVEGAFYKSGEIPPSNLGFSLVDAEWRIETGIS